MKIDDKMKQEFMLLGAHIRKIRESKNLTLKEVSVKTGIRVQYLQKIEKGLAYGVLLDRHLIKTASALQIKPSELFNYEKL